MKIWRTFFRRMTLLDRGILEAACRSTRQECSIKPADSANIFEIISEIFTVQHSKQVWYDLGLRKLIILGKYQYN